MMAHGNLQMDVQLWEHTHLSLFDQARWKLSNKKLFSLLSQTQQKDENTTFVGAFVILTLFVYPGFVTL